MKTKIQSLPVALIDQVVRQQERINELESALKWASLHLDDRFLAALGMDEKNPVLDALADGSNNQAQRRALEARAERKGNDGTTNKD